MSVNKVILIGNLGKKSELPYTPGGQAVANFTLATNERFGGRDGQRAQERTEWHRIVVWGRTAENCGQYLDKAARSTSRTPADAQWQDKEGQKRQTTEIVANTVQFLGGKGGGGGEGMNAGGEDRMAAGVPSGSMEDFGSGGDTAGSDDDLPFRPAASNG
jgi:single-strand DNA-binding protein